MIRRIEQRLKEPDIPGVSLWLTLGIAVPNEIMLRVTEVIRRRA
jgi:hypothetical protein